METDHLGPDYRAETIPLGRDAEGELVATLVERADNPPSGPAVLYVHGFVDYFFHPHVADFYRDRGFAFYAVDLRRSGRSLRPGQTPYFMSSIEEYYPELEQAVRRIRARHEKLVINAHSTGALAAAVWADSVRGRGLIHGMFLNSPFLALNAPPLTRAVGRVFSPLLGKLSPKMRVPVPLSGVNAISLHKDHHGEWDFSLDWKPVTGLPVHMGWLGGVVKAQAKVRRGLRIDVPILAAASTASYKEPGWSPQAQRADAVLDADVIAALAPRLGPDVTVVRIPDGMHDLALSGEAARTRLFKELGEWLDERF
ncbi:alpha/beta hydrolase [Actinorhabdospora filicis]|uniref:Alpha/beta hydrolase n=1 Tax=Actinorhabdospora filicis TaxID=1785913 RepID=A0A9W6SSS6_9ACTN|nr:alpha/beta hydrolase [Actinorhabdospora filicis]GLZ81300.1 alpha/beta hydrolase [Actinorhabdospora filicis]